MPSASYADLIGQILDAMRAAGCAPHNPSVVCFGPPKSGSVHRYRVDGDKSGSANGWFIFYDDGIPAGAFGSWKLNLSETWCAKREHELTDAERTQREKHLAAAKAQRTKEQATVRADARRRAVEIWDKARETIDAKHPYLVRKKIPAIGIRQLKDMLLIPVRDSLGALHSLEFIGADGGKKLLTGGAVAQHYCQIGDLSDAPETLLICEGYATGVSLHIASGLPAVVAFNAGNLRPVAASLRLRYPHTVLIVCGDDDRDTPGNPGRRKAEETATSVSGFAIFPLFDGLDFSASANADKKPTDFNDLHGLAGLDQLKAQLQSALTLCQSPHRRRETFESRIDATDNFEELTHDLIRQILDSGLPKATVTHLIKRIAKKVKVPAADLCEQVKQTTTAHGWKAKLRYDDNGNLRLTLSNLAIILDYHPDWRGVLFYDQFSGDILKRRPPPLPHSETGEWADIDSQKTRVWLEEQFDFDGLSTGLVDDAIAVVSDLHSVHVVKERLDPLQWDGKPRLKTWTIRYLGADDTPTHRFVGQAWMVGAVKRIYEPGCRFDNILVLEGRQGIQKSTALAILGGIWHAESITDVGSKDSLQNLRGMWIVEFSELDAISRVESSRMKQHISARCDVYRPSYGKRSIKVQRQNVFAATTNPQQYLKDETGARRFWPVACGHRIDVDALQADLDQLWAEAMHLYRQGEQTWATPEMTYIAEAQEQRFQTDPWEEHVIHYVYDKPKIQVCDVLDHLRVDVPKQTQADKNRVCKILRRLGYTCKLVRKGRFVLREYHKDE